MRSLSGSISKLVAVAATLTVSIAVPALLVQVGALDAVGRELATPAPSGAQVVVATTQAKPVAVPRRVARQARTSVLLQPAVVQSRTPVTAQPRATEISNPVAVHTAVPAPAPATPSTPPPTTTTPTTTTPATPSTPSTPSTPTTTTTVPPFTTTTVPPPEPPITVPPPPKIVVVNVPPPLGTDVFHDGNPIAVAVTVKANIYVPPPTNNGTTP